MGDDDEDDDDDEESETEVEGVAGDTSEDSDGETVTERAARTQRQTGRLNGVLAAKAKGKGKGKGRAKSLSTGTGAMASLQEEGELRSMIAGRVYSFLQTHQPLLANLRKPSTATRAVSHGPHLTTIRPLRGAYGVCLLPVPGLPRLRKGRGQCLRRPQVSLRRHRPTAALARPHLAGLTPIPIPYPRPRRTVISAVIPAHRRQALEPRFKRPAPPNQHCPRAAYPAWKLSRVWDWVPRFQQDRQKCHKSPMP